MAYCDRCDRYFPHDRALEQHCAASPFHHVCYDCDRDFRSAHALQQHYINSRAHDYCQWCQQDFEDDDDLEDHFREDHAYCDSCSTAFEEPWELREHNIQKHWYCEPCARVFRSENNLDAHLASSVHKPRNVRCPGQGCGRAFLRASDLLLHFEGGKCPSGMTHTELNRIVVRADRNNVVTNPARLIAGPDGPAPAPAPETWATRRSWNPARAAFECFLCHGAFAALADLNRHLQSARHRARIYRCPNRAGCGAEYAVLSALTQHVESGKCGVRRFQYVQDALDSLISGVKRIAL